MIALTSQTRLGTGLGNDDEGERLRGYGNARRQITHILVVLPDIRQRRVIHHLQYSIIQGDISAHKHKQRKHVQRSNKLFILLVVWDKVIELAVACHVDRVFNIITDDDTAMLCSILGTKHMYNVSSQENESHVLVQSSHTIRQPTHATKHTDLDRRVSGVVILKTIPYCDFMLVTSMYNVSTKV